MVLHREADKGTRFELGREVAALIPDARSMSRQGYAAQVQAIIAANPRPSPRHGTVPPGAQAVLDQLAAYGTGEQVRDQLQPWDRAADIVTILLPPGMPWHNIEATLQAAAPSARPGARPRGLSAAAAGQAAPAGTAGNGYATVPERIS